MKQHRQLAPLASEQPDRRLESPYLRADEASVYLRFASRRALYKALAAGLTNKLGDLIPVLRRGETLLFDKGELDSWLHAESVPALKLARTSKKQYGNKVEEGR